MPDIVVPGNDRSVSYSATNGQTVFPYDFPIANASHLAVFKNGLRLTITTHYNVDGVGGEGGGDVTLTSGAALDDLIVIDGDTPAARLSNFNNAGDFRAPTVNAEFNRQVEVDQQIIRNSKRAIRLSDGDDTSPDALTVPAKATRARKALIFGDDGEVIVSDDDYNDQAANAAASAQAAANSADSASDDAAAAAGSASAASGSADAAAASAANAALYSSDLGQFYITGANVGGSANNVTLNIPIIAGALTAGMELTFAMPFAPTGSTTVTVTTAAGAQSPFTLNWSNGGTVASGDLNSGEELTVRYNGMVGRIMSKPKFLPTNSVSTTAMQAQAASYAKIQNVSATDRVLGRSSAGAGVIEEIAFTSQARQLCDDTSFSAMRATLGLGSAAVINSNPFRAVLGSNQTGIVTATWTKIAFGAESFDVGNFFNTTNNRFQPTEAGYYELTGNLEFNTTNIADGSACRSAIYFNGGADIEYGPYNNAATATVNIGSMVTAMRYFNGSTDYAEMYVLGGGAGNKTANSGNTYLHGKRVG
jgi:hypothetical protein